MSEYDVDIFVAAALAGVAMAVCLSGAGILVVGVLRLVSKRNFASEEEVSP